MDHLALAAALCAVIVAYGYFSVRWTMRNPGWYAALPKPAWQPPDIVFGIIWPLNFVALAIASCVLAYQRASTAVTFGLILAVSVVFALTWAYLFYVPHRLLLAAISLTFAALPTWGLVVVAFNEQWWVGILRIPYAVWLSVATSLAYGYAHLVSPTESLTRPAR